MKCSKAQVHTKCQQIATIRFQKQNLTSFSGLVLLSALFARLKLACRLKKCFHHIRKSSIYKVHVVVQLLIVHLLLGFRRLREIDHYRNDPMILGQLGLRELPDVSTVSRILAEMDEKSVVKFRDANRELVLGRLEKAGFPRVTIDFDGSVLSHKGHAEGSAVGYNPKKRGARSYYPLFGTIAQTGQFFDLHHRPGNVNDINGAEEFMLDCYDELYRRLPGVKLESRVDSAFFSDKIVSLMEDFDVEYSISVPFERLVDLKGIIERRQRWNSIDKEWSYFELQWKLDCWQKKRRFLCVRHRIQQRRKGPLQLDLFEPKSFEFEYKVILTNKTVTAGTVVQFHNGRGSQEGLLGEAKQNTGLDVIPSRRLFANQVFTICAMMAHNLGREMQMMEEPRSKVAQPKRSAAWDFQTIGTIRRLYLLRAGRLARPQGKRTLIMNANDKVEQGLTMMLNALKMAG